MSSSRGRAAAVILGAIAFAALCKLCANRSSKKCFPWRRLLFRRDAGSVNVTPCQAVEILDEICRGFHVLMTELCQTRSSVIRQMESRGLQNVFDESELLQVLMQGFEPRLAAVEAAAVAKLGISSAEFNQLCEDLQGDSAVAARTQGIATMMRDVQSGKLPLLPAATLPLELREDRDFVLRILRIVKERRIQKFTLILENATPQELLPTTQVNGSKLPSAELNAQLAAAADSAELEVLKEMMTPPLTDITLYRHALALHSRDAMFALERAALEEAFSEKIVALIREALDRGEAGVSAATSIESLTKRRLREAVKQHKDGFVVCVGAVPNSVPNALDINSLSEYAECAAIMSNCPELAEADLPCFLFVKEGRFLRMVKTAEEALAAFVVGSTSIDQPRASSEPVETQLSDGLSPHE